MTQTIKRMSDLETDLARRHRQSAQGNGRIEPTDEEKLALERDGYVILTGLLDDAELDAIRNDCEALIGNTGRNSFEGLKTQRIYSPLSKMRTMDGLATHPRILGLLDHMLLPNYLLSQAQAINILPGEASQMLHYDDAFYRVPRPRPAMGAATIWAINEFTAENGSTVLIPGSHHWASEEPPSDAPTLSAVMPAGSVLFFVGTLWHGGGANRSDKSRLAITCQYCEPWLRQQENFLLEIPREMAAELPETLQSLIGYSVHPPFMGMVEGMHPKRLLQP